MALHGVVDRGGLHARRHHQSGQEALGEYHRGAQAYRAELQQEDEEGGISSPEDLLQSIF